MFLQVIENLDDKFIDLMEKSTSHVHSDTFEETVVSLVLSIESWSLHISRLNFGRRDNKNVALTSAESTDFYNTIKIWNLQIQTIVNSISSNSGKEQLIYFKTQVQDPVNNILLYNTERSSHLECKLQQFHSSCYKIFIEGIIHASKCFRHLSLERLEITFSQIRTAAEVSRFTEELIVLIENITGSITEYCMNQLCQVLKFILFNFFF